MSVFVDTGPGQHTFILLFFSSLPNHGEMGGVAETTTLTTQGEDGEEDLHGDPGVHLVLSGRGPGGASVEDGKRLLRGSKSDVGGGAREVV